MHLFHKWVEFKVNTKPYRKCAWCGELQERSYYWLSHYNWTSVEKTIRTYLEAVEGKTIPCIAEENFTEKLQALEIPPEIHKMINDYWETPKGKGHKKKLKRKYVETIYGVVF